MIYHVLNLATIFPFPWIKEPDRKSSFIIKDLFYEILFEDFQKLEYHDYRFVILYH